MALDSVVQCLKRANSVQVKSNQSKMRDDLEGEFSAELHFAESVKIRWQQLETSVNVTNGGSCDSTGSGESDSHVHCACVVGYTSLL